MQPPTVPWLSQEASKIITDEGVPAGITTYVAYGDYTFPAAVSMKFQVEPVMDSSERHPKWWKHIFTIETVISSVDGFSGNFSGTSTGLKTDDLNMSQIRRRLNLPGLKLQIFSKGVGQNQRFDPNGLSPTGEPVPRNYTLSTNQDPNVSTGTGLGDPDDTGTLLFSVDGSTDLNFGPKPTLLLCEPMGDSRVMRIVWTVECCLPICCVAYTTNANNRPVVCLTPYSANNPLAGKSTLNTLTDFSYSMSWSIDEQGYTVRSIVGTIEVAGRLNQGLNDPTLGEGKLFDYGSDPTLTNFTTASVLNVDFWREALTNTFGKIAQFNREYQFDLGRNHRRMDFRITDTEIKSVAPYFPGIIKCEARASMEAPMPFAKWNYNIEGTFEAMVGKPKYLTWLAFLVVIRSRLANVMLGTKTLYDAVSKKTYTGPAAIFPRNIYIEEDIFGTTCTFSFKYMLISSLNNIFKAGNFFSKPPGDWNQWNLNQPQAFFTGAGNQGLGARGSRDLADPRKINGSSSSPYEAELISTTCNQQLPDNIGTKKGIPEDQIQFTYLFRPACDQSMNWSYIDLNYWFTLVRSKGSYASFSAKGLDDSTNGDYDRPLSSMADAFPITESEAQSYSGAIVSSSMAAVNSSMPRYFATKADTTLLVFQGHALRLCNKPQVPSLTEYQAADGQWYKLRPAPKQLIPTTPNFTKESILGQAGATPMYAVVWRRTYLLDKPVKPDQDLWLSLKIQGTVEQVMVNVGGDYTPKGD